MFQEMAPRSAARTTACVASCGLTRPVAMVCAMALICVAPIKLSVAAMRMAVSGLRTRVAMTVETTFAAS